MIRATRRLAIALGLAVGDALGSATEGMSPERAAAAFAPGDGYKPGPVGFEPGQFSDDGQAMACLLAAYWDHRLRDGDLAESAVARLAEWIRTEPRGTGATSRGALARAETEGILGGFAHWRDTGYQAASNGGLMRAAASVIADSRGEQLRREAIVLSAITHPDPRSLTSCLALVAALERLANDEDPNDAWAAVLDEVESFPVADVVAERFGDRAGAEVAERLESARESTRAAIQAGLEGRPGRQGLDALETLQAAVVGSLAPSFREGVDPIIRRGSDSDTAAAVAGALLAARGLDVPGELLVPLRSGHAWPLWPRLDDPAVPVLAALVPAGRPTRAEPVDDPEARRAAQLYSYLNGFFSFDRLHDRLLAGRNPLFRSNAWVIFRAGVTHVLDLRERFEWDSDEFYGRSALDELDLLGVVRLSAPIGDRGTPSDEVFTAAAAYVEAIDRVGGRLYAHCRAGEERTAAVLAAWYARGSGLSLEDAVALMRQRRPSFRPMSHQLEAAQSWLDSQGGRFRYA